jgi:PadR family transcriptional regulator, regulatory protein PadR
LRSTDAGREAEVNIQDDTAQSLLLEMRRGTAALSVLCRLHEPQYGYRLGEILEGDRMGIEPGTLYPMLRRLEKQGLLTSAWETTGAKPRKYYQITKWGSQVQDMLLDEWKALSAGFTDVAEKGER